MVKIIWQNSFCYVRLRKLKTRYWCLLGGNKIIQVAHLNDIKALGDTSFIIEVGEMVGESGLNGGYRGKWL